MAQLGFEAAESSFAHRPGQDEGTSPCKRRRRKKSKPGTSIATATERYSYSTSWEAYIDGNVVSETIRRYITNLLAATAATKTEQEGDSSEDSDAEAWRDLSTTAPASAHQAAGHRRNATPTRRPKL